MLANWQPTLGGILTSIGLALTGSDNPTLHTVGVILAAIGSLLTGATARQWNVTSEQSGAK